MNSTTTPASKEIRQAIDAFLTERFEQKAGALAEGDEKRQKLVAQFERETWVADAAKRVKQIQLATHLIKALHPSAKGSSLYRPASDLPETPYITSRLTGDSPARDVVGNAAALDVYKVLQLAPADKSLLDRILLDEPGVAESFSDNPAAGAEWVAAFRSIADSRGPAASHTLAKQIYFPLDNCDYHLLAPLYPSALIHRVNGTIREHRISEAAKAARKARKEKAPSDTKLREYRDLAIQKLGGSKPQNISQLNSERYGDNYLLASIPPVWKSADIRPPLGTPSAFRIFARRPDVRDALRGLAYFLSELPERVNNVHIRTRRAAYVEAICDELVLFAAELQQFEPGWSADERCRLPTPQQYWLDPYRADTDETFDQARKESDWPQTVAVSFSNWLIQSLERRRKKLKFDDEVFRAWRKELSGRLKQMEQEIVNGL